MESWIFWIMVITVTWIPAGYLGSRLWNAWLFLQEPRPSYEVKYMRDLLNFSWKRKISNPEIFGWGVFLGWLTFCVSVVVFLLTSLIAAIYEVIMFASEVARFFGKLAPK